MVAATLRLWFMIGDGDSKQDCRYQAEEDQCQKYGSGDGPQKVETASEEDDDSYSANGSEGDWRAADAKETQESGSVTGDRNKEESTPEEGLSKMHK
jgi:hypothetical protein